MKKIKPIERTRTLKIVLPLLLLLGIGLIMVYDASVIEAQNIFNDKYYFARQNAIWIGIGLLLTFIVSRLPTSLFFKISPLLLFASLITLIAVLIPGIGNISHGAQRWIKLGIVSFQPSEIAKFTTVLYLATWFKKKPPVFPFLILIGLISLLLLLQPDLGTTVIIIATSFLMLFLTGIKWRKIIILGVIGIIAATASIVISPYRLQRLTTFFDPTRDKLGTSYHINQILISLGSGGPLGVGLGRSRQKFQYLPEATTDSIFAVIGEEMGFVGTFGVILLFAILYYQLYKITLRESSAPRKFLSAGLTGWLTFQTLINLGGMVALIPLTGVPLPFISYGRSTLLTQLISIGILIRISLTQK